MRNFSAEIRWDGQSISGLSAVTPLRSTTDVITFHEGGGATARHAPGRSDTDSITFSRGASDDLAFDLWARGPVLRKEVQLTLVDTSEGLTVTYRVSDCWVCGYSVAPDLDTGEVIESLSLSTGQWHRVSPPAPELAERLAGERGVPVHRIDVRALLGQMREGATAAVDAELAGAEQSGAFLLLDEADALFAKRSEVQDSRDRYADMEVSLLLQRLSSYRGRVVVETPQQRADSSDPTRSPD